jgi:hypothetical protein
MAATRDEDALSGLVDRLTRVRSETGALVAALLAHKRQSGASDDAYSVFLKDSVGLNASDLPDDALNKLGFTPSSSSSSSDHKADSDNASQLQPTAVVAQGHTSKVSAPKQQPIAVAQGHNSKVSAPKKQPAAVAPGQKSKVSKSEKQPAAVAQGQKPKASTPSSSSPSDHKSDITSQQAVAVPPGQNSKVPVPEKLMIESKQLLQARHKASAEVRAVREAKATGMCVCMCMCVCEYVNVCVCVCV